MLPCVPLCPPVSPCVPPCPPVSLGVPSCPRSAGTHVPACPSMSPQVPTPVGTHVPLCPPVSPGVPPYPLTPMYLCSICAWLAVDISLGSFGSHLEHHSVSSLRVLRSPSMANVDEMPTMEAGQAAEDDSQMVEAEFGHAQQCSKPARCLQSLCGGHQDAATQLG